VQSQVQRADRRYCGEGLSGGKATGAGTGTAAAAGATKAAGKKTDVKV
jgi:hypothetical protein